jgi:hypothetical protein
MSLTYSTFVSSLANMLVIPPTDANYLAIIPNVIDDSEQRLYRELDLLATIIRDSSGTLTPNSRNFTFPQHFVVSESINVFTPVGSTTSRKQLIPISREALDAIWGDEEASMCCGPSVPEYYAMITDQTIIVGPAPDGAYTMEVIGTIRPAPLSATNPNTYLTMYLPDLFFAEALIFGYGYLKDFGAATDDPQSTVGWGAHYKALWDSANTEENRKKYASQAWTPKQPAPLATPPRA